MKTLCDTMISAAFVAPVQPRGVVLRETSLVISSGEIVHVLPTRDALAQYYPKTHVERPHHLVIPGLVNAHGHAAMTLLRSSADDLPLSAWLRERIWPVERKWLSAEFVRLGSELAVLEMLSSGTTCFSDMYFFPDQTAEVALRAGIRAAVGLVVVDFPTPWAKDADEYLARGLEVERHYFDAATIHPMWAPHSPYAVSDEAFRKLLRKNEELALSVHTHVCETAGEVQDSRKAYGLTQVERLEKLGLLDHRLVAAHFVHPEPGDIELLASRGAHVVHCPESNAKLASGMADAAALRGAGIVLGLGTDGAASNNNLDMIEEMRTAALVGKLRTGDAASSSAHEVLEMATLGGAATLGLGDRLGSLEVGKIADVTCVDLRHARTWPVHDPVSILVYGACGTQVTDTWVEGRHVFAAGRCATLDADELFERAAHFQAKLAASPA